MFKIILIMLVVVTSLLYAPQAFASSFCEGWNGGYKAGYCYRQYGCLAPLVPLCPLPRLGENTYQEGYNRGFLAGLNAR